MDIEKLTKSQIILLGLLVSFVTSIATGIVTVSLMEQAPPAMAQTVNRVIERTVEKVVPSGQAAAVVTTEKTVIVKESDLIATALKKLAPSVVQLYARGKDASGKDTEVFLGLGLVISNSGAVLADIASLPASGSIEIGVGDARIPASVARKKTGAGLAVLQATSSEQTWAAASIAGAPPSLGETVVSVAEHGATRIADGIVVALPSGKKTGETPVSMIETNIPSDAIVFGSVLMDVDGSVVGFSTAESRALSEKTFLAASELLTYNASSEGGAEQSSP